VLRRFNAVKAFTAKDAKDAKENKVQRIICRITHLVLAIVSTAPLLPFASLALRFNRWI
jgi:hypothetical protein